MISPHTYALKYLIGKRTKTILERVDKLRNEIAELKRKIEYPTEEEQLVISFPSNQTRLSCERKYLEEAFKILDKRKVKYQKTEEEKKNTDFLASLPYIKSIHLHMGEHTPNIRNLEVIFNSEDAVIRKSSLSPDNVPQNEERIEEKEIILEKMADLYMGEWKDYYCKEKTIISDGTQWELTIHFTNKDEPMIVRGDNVYPYNFLRFLSIFGAEDLYHCDKK